MKFKLIENYDYALDDLRSLVQEYIYDAIDDLGSSSLDKYITWYIEEFRGYDIDIDLLEKVVTDKYIDAIDTGKIKANKTKLTSELKQYIESNKHLLTDVEELVRQCPEHLQHELKLVIDAADLNESLTEELLTEGPRGQTDLRKFICELLNQVCKTVLNFNDFMIHHKDGDHNNNHPKNIVLLPVGTRAVRTTGAVATNKHGKILTNPNSSIHKYITNNSSGVVQSTDHPEYINIINNYNAIDVWRSLQKHNLVYLDDKLLKRDLNKSLKNPTGRIK